jgi:hypothetical protein
MEKSRRGFPIYKANPFIHKIMIDARKKYIAVAKGELDVVHREDGELFSPATIGAFIQVEKNEFIKVYTNEMKSFFDLSKVGTRMMGIVFRACQKESINKSEIFLTHKVAKEIYYEISESGEELSVPSYQRGIKELIKKEFIAEHPLGSGWFYTNPNIFFNGNRMRFVKEYCQTDAFKEVKKQLLGEAKQLSLLP